jgi:hypothetical protein
MNPPTCGLFRHPIRDALQRPDWQSTKIPRSCFDDEEALFGAADGVQCRCRAEI